MFGSAIFLDVNDDGIDDVFTGGRSAELSAIDGKSGNEIWRFNEVNSLDAMGIEKLFNFYKIVL